MSRVDELLAILPPVVAQAVGAARAKRDETQGAWGPMGEAMEPAREAVGFLPNPHGTQDIPLASQLTAPQRALAEVAVLERLFLRAPLPTGDALARYLGIAPPGPLEREIDDGGARIPLWLALRRAGSDEAKIVAILDALPIEHALEACAEFPAHSYRVWGTTSLPWRTRVPRDLKGEGRTWALETLRRWTPRPDDGRTTAGGMIIHRSRAIPRPTTNWAFLALVRAGAPIDPAWDELLPLDEDVPDEIVRECAAVLPLDRVERAALDALPEVHGSAAIAHGTLLLEAFDSGPIARLVLKITEKSYPQHRKVERAKIEQIGQRHPSVMAAYREATRRAPKARALTVIARSTPKTESDLSEVQAAQLVAAGERWDGQALPAARRLSIDESDEAAMGLLLEHVVIADEKKQPVYDAWLYAGDGGTFFRTGTTQMVAERIQDGIRLHGSKDEALRDALQRLGASSGVIADAPATPEKKAAAAAKKKAPTAKKKPAPR